MQLAYKLVALPLTVRLASVVIGPVIPSLSISILHLHPPSPSSIRSGGDSNDHHGLILTTTRTVFG